jgi:uncharacterized coiled-coil DUF342 family protein
MEDLKTKEYIEPTGDYADDYYDDNLDRYYKPNTKNDVGSTRFKYIPLHKVTLETEVPAEPQEKHDKPNDSHYEKEIKKIEEEINKHLDNIKALNEKIKKEKTGNSPDFNAAIEQVRDLNTTIKKLSDEKDELEKSFDDPNKAKKNRETKDRLEKEVDFKNLKQAQSIIEQIQEQLGFSQLSATEEKKLLEKKNKIEAQLPKIKKLEEVRQELNTVRESNKGPFEQLKELKKKIYDLVQKRKTLSTKIDVFKSNFNENKQEVESLKLQKNSIFEEIEKLKGKKYDLKKEWDDKWYKFEQYTKIMDHIKEIKKKQAEIVKREEKLKKKAEKDAKKEGKEMANTPAEINIVQTGESEEYKTCKILISYFESLISKDQPKKVEEKNTKNAMSDKLVEDLKKGLIEIVDKNALISDQEIGIPGKGKKKDKGPKISKREQKVLNSDLLVLGVDVSSQIASIGLNAPEKKNQVEAFIKTLEAKLQEYKPKDK